jgi:putative solute:sodium symporter small subunit
MAQEDRYHVNIFKPVTEFQKTETVYIWIILAFWAVGTYGFQLLLRLVQENPAGESFLTRMRFLGFPFHYWWSGQFMIIVYILLCIWFNILIDGLEERHGKADI